RIPGPSALSTHRTSVCRAFSAAWAGKKQSAAGAAAKGRRLKPKNDSNIKHAVLAIDERLQRILSAHPPDGAACARSTLMFGISPHAAGAVSSLFSRKLSHAFSAALSDGSALSMGREIRTRNK